ncbi:MAG: TlyA family RNA methyltransferase [Spirochaetales bacterium]|nr:TlyA family RNA methyltransferase [Spirochaetales bacterium]
MKERYPEIEEKKLFAYIMCGDVVCNGGRIRNPKEKVKSNSVVYIEGMKYVSRGGYKLESGLDKFNYSVKDLTVIDAGCSTGGFTDCLLQRGAKKVFAIDVGSNQLAWSLVNDARVVPMEKTNIMSIDSLDPRPDFAVADLSFRSVLSPAKKLFELISGDEIIVLVKPQFEWENPDQDFNGVIKEGETILSICINLIEKLEDIGIYVKDITLSKTKGRKGNQELLFLLTTESSKSHLNSTELLLEVFVE